jgi:hypothetical protein
VTATGVNGPEPCGKRGWKNAASVGKKGGIMNIRESQYFTLTKKGSLRYSYAPFLASSHSSFGWGKSETGKRVVNTLHEACL